MTQDIRENAIRFTMGVLRRARDWQDGEDALANHPVYGPWLAAGSDDPFISEAQSIIREAEDRLGDALPY